MTMSEEHLRWVTIGTFPFGMDTVYIEHELAAHGIAYKKLDETTIQVVPHLSQALGGVRLQVAPRDVDRALKILSDAGVEIEPEQPGSSLLLAFDKWTEKVPVIRSVPLGWRFLLVFAVVVSLLGCGVYLLFAPSLSEQLVARHWCAHAVDHNGSSLQIGTDGHWRIIMSQCPERVVFSTNGTVQFPGIGTPEVNASWEVVGRRIRVYDADTLREVYEGEYAVVVDDFRMVMRSATTSITTERDRTIENMRRGL